MQLVDRPTEHTLYRWPTQTQARSMDETKLADRNMIETDVAETDLTETDIAKP